MLKRRNFFSLRILRLCKSLDKISFLQEQNYCTWGWTWAENQKRQISGCQNYMLLIKKV